VKLFLKLFNKTITIMAVIGSIMLASMAVTIGFQVIMRYFFNQTFVWIQDINEYILLWSVYLGAAYVLRNEDHIEMGLFLTKMNNKTRNLAQMINSMIGTVICFLLSWFGFIAVWTNYTRNTTVIKGLVMPKYLVILPIFIGSVLLTVQFLIRAYNFYIGYKNNGSTINTNKDEEVII